MSEPVGGTGRKGKERTLQCRARRLYRKTQCGWFLVLIRRTSAGRLGNIKTPGAGGGSSYAASGMFSIFYPLGLYDRLRFRMAPYGYPSFTFVFFFSNIYTALLMRGRARVRVWPVMHSAAVWLHTIRQGRVPCQHPSMPFSNAERAMYHRRHDPTQGSNVAKRWGEE